MRNKETGKRVNGEASPHVYSFPRLLVYLFILLYALTLSWLSLERHAAHQTNALDLGYYSNTLWNTAHGMWFRFSTFHDANFVFPEFDPNAIKQQENLLAYHVEPILLPLSLLYLLWPDPRALLILQSLVLASGAWPAYQIARRHLVRGDVSPKRLYILAFPLIYLMSPSLIGANLSDFHPVTFSAALFLWAFDALERRAFKTFFVFVVLILSLKEEMGLMVAAWAIVDFRFLIFDWLNKRQRARRKAPITNYQSRILNLQSLIANPRTRLALTTLALATAWTIAAVLIQRDAAGRQVSLFTARYSWLGHTLREVIVNTFTTPAIVDWLRQPDVIGYLGLLLAQGGFVALLAPEILLIALPEIAITAFSKFEWMRSGVAHYSAPIVPFLLIAAIIGLRRLGHWKVASPSADRRPPTADRHSPSAVRRRLSFALLVFIALTSAAYQFYRAGQLPFTQDFAPYAITAHHQRLAGITARIPPTAKVTAQSDLYPHVPERADLYLFPTISDADYILLDVSGQTYPINPLEYAETVKRLLYESPVGIVAAEDGYLLLARNEGDNRRLPDAFFAFARGDAKAIQHPMSVRFSDDLELLGYDFELLAPRNVPAPAANVRTYWRALRPPADNMQFIYHFYAPEGYLSYNESQSPTELWYPTKRWQVGETIVVEQRGVQVQHGGKIGISVERGDKKEPPQVSAAEMVEAGVVKLQDVSRQ